MSQENVDIVKQWFAAYNGRDLEGILALSTADLEFRSVFAGIESGGVFRGHAGLADYFTAIGEAYERFQVLPTEFLDAEAATVVTATARWEGRASSAAGSTVVFPVLWVQDGRVTRGDSYLTRTDALEAAGLSSE